MKTFFTILFFSLNIVSLFGQTNTTLFPTIYSGETKKGNSSKNDTTSLSLQVPEQPTIIELNNNAALHFPYPVIFIHGLTGSADTWTDFYNNAIAQNWSYGGWLKFCLNSDNDNTFSNITNSTSSDVADFNSSVVAADFYLINFNIDADGTGYGSGKNTKSLSNQAAIEKQGLALKVAISKVLKATGRDKVILFGHSMGGLAARQYLQNSNLWQTDGKHHIAKLITSGTPHGGSNATSLNVVPGLEEKSDAVRDLRRSYFYSNTKGVFLFGGKENKSNMDDFLTTSFFNFDVNCNGKVNETIVGLNEKSISTNLDYSCIVGDWKYDLSLCNPGDGVVEVEDAKFKNFYKLTCETFTITSKLVERLHTHLTEYTTENFYGLDEPDYFNLSYNISTGATYNGFISMQSDDAEFDTDYDDYLFTLTQPAYVTIPINNVYIDDLGVSIYKVSDTKNYVIDNHSNNSEKFTTKQVYLQAGSYYLEIYGDPLSNSWKYPYNFTINASNKPVSTENIATKELLIYPNPSSGTFNIRSENVITDIQISTVQGQIIDKFDEYNGQINISNYENGVYIVQLKENGNLVTSKIIIQK